MKLKTFIVSGFVGGIVNYLLGWLFWGILFKNSFPSDETKMNMTFIFLGCMTFSFFMAYIFNFWIQIIQIKQGITAGLIFALFLSLHSNFFQHSMELVPNIKMMLTDISLTLICGAIVGGTISFISSKMQ